MKFPLSSFTTSLDATLIEKGKRWYSEGMVQHVQNKNECVWYADIIGPNKQFKVQVEIIGKNVNYVFCNCGPRLCSHVVALLFELLEKNYPTEKYYTGTEGKVTQDGEVKVVSTPLVKALQNIDLKDLKKFVTEYANKNEEFRESFLSRFGNIDIDRQVARYNTIIRSTLKYERMWDAVDGTKDVLKDAEKNFKEENYEVVFAACKAVLTQWADFVRYEKHAGYVFNDAIKLLHAVVLQKDLSATFKVTLFNYICQLYKTPHIEDYQDGDLWSYAFISFAPSKAHLQKVVALIDAKVEKTSDYYKGRFLGHQEEVEEAIKSMP